MDKYGQRDRILHVGADSTRFEYFQPGFVQERVSSIPKCVLGTTR